MVKTFSWRFVMLIHLVLCSIVRKKNILNLFCMCIASVSNLKKPFFILIDTFKFLKDFLAYYGCKSLIADSLCSIIKNEIVENCLFIRFLSSSYSKSYDYAMKCAKNHLKIWKSIGIQIAHETSLKENLLWGDFFSFFQAHSYITWLMICCGTPCQHCNGCKIVLQLSLYIFIILRIDCWINILRYAVDEFIHETHDKIFL